MSTRATTQRTALTRAAIGAVLLSAVAGCAGSTAPGTAEPSGTPPTAASAAASTPAPAPAQVPGAAEADITDVAALPAGPPPRVHYLAGGLLHWPGTTIGTDFPAYAVRPQILGVVGGRTVLTAFVADGPDSGDRFWSIDVSGHAERLGGTYRSYDYAPRLVARTGHIWVQYGDRTTARTIWELDARTGRQIAAYTHNRVPHGLAPVDQALVDAWVQRREAVPDTEDRSRDGSLFARTRAVSGLGDSVVVRRRSDRGLVARFTFPAVENGDVERVVIEDGDHVLMLYTVSFTRRHGSQQAIVRCSISAGTCERATAVGGNMALGLIRPLFEPEHSHR